MRSGEQRMGGRSRAGETERDGAFARNGLASVFCSARRKHSSILVHPPFPAPDEEKQQGDALGSGAREPRGARPRILRLLPLALARWHHLDGRYSLRRFAIHLLLISPLGHHLPLRPRLPRPLARLHDPRSRFFPDEDCLLPSVLRIFGRYAPILYTGRAAGIGR